MNNRLLSKALVQAVYDFFLRHRKALVSLFVKFYGVIAV